MITASTATSSRRVILGMPPPSTHLTYPSKPISGGDGYYTHAVTLHGYHGTWAGLAARCLIIIIIIFHLLSAVKIIIICYN